MKKDFKDSCIGPGATGPDSNTKRRNLNLLLGDWCWGIKYEIQAVVNGIYAHDQMSAPLIGG